MNGWRGFIERILNLCTRSVFPAKDDGMRVPARGEIVAPTAPPVGIPRGAESETAWPSIDHLLWSLDDVLEQAHQSGPDAQAEPVEVCALIARVAARNGYASTRLQIIPAPWPLFVQAKTAELERLFEILITATFETGTRTIIRVDRGTSAMIAYVDDDGPGVPRNKRDLLFAPQPAATQNASTAPLAVARDIARALGGDITVSSSPQGGARYAVRMPLVWHGPSAYAAVAS